MILINCNNICQLSQIKNILFQKEICYTVHSQILQYYICTLFLSIHTVVNVFMSYSNPSRVPGCKSVDLLFVMSFTNVSTLSNLRCIDRRSMTLNGTYLKLILVRLKRVYNLRSRKGAFCATTVSVFTSTF